MISRHLIDELNPTIKPRFCILIQEMCIYAKTHTPNLRYFSFILDENPFIFSSGIKKELIEHKFAFVKY